MFYGLWIRFLGMVVLSFMFFVFGFMALGLTGFSGLWFMLSSSGFEGACFRIFWVGGVKVLGRMA